MAAYRSKFLIMQSWTEWSETSVCSFSSGWVLLAGNLINNWLWNTFGWAIWSTLQIKFPWFKIHFNFQGCFIFNGRGSSANQNNYIFFRTLMAVLFHYLWKAVSILPWQPVCRSIWPDRRYLWKDNYLTTNYLISTWFYQIGQQMQWGLIKNKKYKKKSKKIR